MLTAAYGPSGLPGQEPVTLRAPVGRAATAGAFGLLAGCGDVDDVTAARLYRPVTDRVPVPRVGPVVWSEDFSGPLGPEWTWVREPAATVASGQLVWPTQAGDLTGTGNDASVLLRDAPAGAYTVEAKVTIDLGVHTVRNYQQAGLVIYRGDDDFLRLTHVAIWNTRTTEYGKEQVSDSTAGQPAYGSMLVAPPADTTWLRLAHRVDPGTGEHTYRAAVSTRRRALDLGWRVDAARRRRPAHRPGLARGSRRDRRVRPRPRPPTLTPPARAPAPRPKEHPMTATSGSGFSRRNFLGLSAAVGAAGLTAACGGGTSGPPGTQDQGTGGEFTGEYTGPNVQLDFWNGFTGGDGPFMKKLVDQFNAEHHEHQGQA